MFRQLAIFLLLGILSCSPNINKYYYGKFPHGSQKVTIYDDRLYFFEMNWGLGYNYSFGLLEVNGDTLLLLPPSSEGIHVDTVKTPLNDSTTFTFSTNHPNTKSSLFLKFYRKGACIDKRIVNWNNKYKLALQPKDSLEIWDIDHIYTLTLDAPLNKHYSVFYDDHPDENFQRTDTLRYLIKDNKLYRLRDGKLTEEIFERTKRK